MVDYDLLIPYGWNTTSYTVPEGAVPGRVIRTDRGECDVATPSGPARASLPRADTGFCTGDWVLLEPATGLLPLAVTALLPRRGAISRSSVSGRSAGQVLAANVDTVLICVPADGDVDLGRIERLLALAWESGAQPVVVLTKVDAAESVPLDAVRAVAPGAPVLGVSASSGDGLEVLTAVLDGTVVLLGPSGAGKSTLANALLGEEAFATGAVRASDGKGRHTTVQRELRPLPHGGTLIDTPGLRGIGLFDAADGLEKTFSDVENLAGACRFNDCGHETEPGCAVRAALESGALTERRLASYRKLLRENAYMAARTDKRLAAERERAWREVHRQQRRMYRERGSGK